MTAQVARMRRDGAEVIAAIGLGKDLAVLRRTMARLHFNVPLVASNGALGQPFQDGAGELVTGVQGTMIAAFGERPMRPATRAFAEAYKKKYGADRWWGSDPENPQLFMAISVSNAYDAVNILFEGIRRAQSSDPKKINAAIEGIHGWEGVNAVYSFSPTVHNAIQPEGLRVFEYKKQGARNVLVPVSG
jgi:branched-chain amino acid transport system substrate-binding protein